MKQQPYKSTDELIAIATSDPDSRTRENTINGDLKNRAFEAVLILGTRSARAYLAQGKTEVQSPPAQMLAMIMDGLRRAASADPVPEVRQAATSVLGDLEQVVSGRRQCCYCGAWVEEGLMDSRGYCGPCSGAS